jgi:hypothetical protein
VWEDLLANAFEGPSPEELRESDQIKGRLEQYAGGDESLRVLSVRGRSRSTSRFEMPPELWQALSAGGTSRPSLLRRDSPCRS